MKKNKMKRTPKKLRYIFLKFKNYTSRVKQHRNDGKKIMRKKML